MDIKIDITDWHEAYQAQEPKLNTFDDVLNLRKRGVKPYAAGVLTIVARERGDAEANILPTNKVLLGTGAARYVQARRGVAGRSGQG